MDKLYPPYNNCVDSGKNVKWTKNKLVRQRFLSKYVPKWLI